jgi:hypothetical protein
VTSRPQPPEENSQPAVTALITYGGQRWTLADGESLVVGRKTSCQVQVGANSIEGEDIAWKPQITGQLSALNDA